MLRNASSKTIGPNDAAQRTLLTVILLTLVLTSDTLLSQSTNSVSRHVLEFPAILRQSVTAGTTPIGTKVQAKLTVATLVNGVVIPRDAVLSGEVIESAAKSGTEPSRPAIRMDSAQWKNGGTEIAAYLTPWFYPARPIPGDTRLDSAPSPADGTNRRSPNPIYSGSPTPPFPAPAHDKDTDPTPAPDSQTPRNRVALKNVLSAHNHAGAITLMSMHSNIKLDKYTAYVFATGDAQMTK